MLSRRMVLGLLASATSVAASGIALAKKKQHQNGRALLGEKIKQNGKHKLHKAGKVDVSVDVSNGKVVGLTASLPEKGNLTVRKVKSRQKLAEETPGLILAGMQFAQYYDYYYGYWFDDGVDDWYYWFPVEYVIVDETWVEYTY
jgi:hypothetical protein